MCRFNPPRTLSACEAATLEYARDGTLSDPKNIIMKWYVNWLSASAQQIERVMVRSGWDNLHLPQHVDEVLVHCEVCIAFDRVPHVPVAGTATASTFFGQLQVDLPFSDDAVASHVLGVFSRYSLLTPARSKNPQGV